MLLIGPEGRTQPLFLPASNSDHNKTHSCHQRKRAENWGNREGVLLFVGYLYRPQVSVLFLVREADTSHPEADDTENDENDSYNCRCFITPRSRSPKRVGQN